VRLTIINKDAKEAIFSVWTILTLIREEANSYIEYSFLDPAFFAILGTPNRGSTISIIIDYKVDLRYRLIDKIVVLRNKDLKLDQVETYTIVIFLENERITLISSPTKDGSPSKKQKLG